MASMGDHVSSISILIVEDDAVAVNLLFTILSRKFPDVVVHTAINGRTGLELFTKHLPDIVISDINMPEMSGVHMAGKIRAIKPDTKFIILSGDTGELALQDSAGNGFEFDHYLVKPVAFKEFFAAIEQCIGEIACSRQ
jgi:YesN/AraC family two-component response regulator